jgi:NADH dehydrogenase
VANIGKLRFGGFIAWLLWLAIHVLYLVGFKNRVTTVLHWAVSFIGRGRAQRTVPQHHLLGVDAGKGMQVPDPPRSEAARTG